MKTVWMTDDELLAAATLQPDADHPLLLPSIPRDDESALTAAVDRGFRSLRIRATENEPQRWAGVLDLINALISRQPVVTAVWVDAVGRPSGPAPITRYHDLGDDLSVAELVQPTGLHSFGLTRNNELGDALRALVRSVQEDGPQLPPDWPETVPAPTGLLLASQDGRVIVSAGGAQLLAADGAATAYADDELASFVERAFPTSQAIRA